MKTNLIFKKQLEQDNKIVIVTKVVPVNIPEIELSDGWKLQGLTDIIEVCSTAAKAKSTKKTKSKEAEEWCAINTSKFETDTVGTAKLVRAKGIIKIVQRRGKKTYNETTKNSVCIDDDLKVKFFGHCEYVYSCRGIWEFNESTANGEPYKFWDTIMKEEFKRQQDLHIKKVAAKLSGRENQE